MDVTLEELLRTFIAEAEENLSTMEEGLLALERNPDDEETIHTVFRMAHSVKGSAACVGYDTVASFAHALEDLLDRVREGAVRANGNVVTALLLAVDVLRDLVASPDRTSLNASEQALVQVIGDLAREDETAAKKLDLWRGTRRTEVRRATVRVETERIDRMVDLSGEIAISRGRMRQLLDALPADLAAPLVEAYGETERHFLGLQELVMKTRMVPVGTLLAAFHRTVRDLAREQGKIARLTVTGAGVEIDHGVADKLRDPLAHMIRNAIDHGLELPEARVAAGKDPCGRISISASHESGTIVIRVSDDGGGIDRARVVAQARAHGLVDDHHTLTDAETLALIFRPGFSTAAGVNDLSGRGVGMDVVKRNIESLHGAIAIESNSGGTTVTVKAPLTLAIIDGFGVRVGEEHYVIPLPLVTECLQLSSAHDRDTDGGILDLRGEPVPFVRLQAMWGRPGGGPTLETTSRENVVIVQCNNERLGIAVDHLIGESQIVVKPMSDFFRDVRGISGSAILGNGRVALILDVPLLLEELKETA